MVLPARPRAPRRAASVGASDAAVPRQRLRPHGSSRAAESEEFGVRRRGPGAPECRCGRSELRSRSHTG